MSELERKASDDDPLWSQFGQVFWLLQQAELRSVYPLRTVDIANAMRIHNTRASELLNHLMRVGYIAGTRRGRQLYWSLHSGGPTGTFEDNRASLTDINAVRMTPFVGAS